MGTLTIIGRHLHVHTPDKYISVQPKEKREESLEIKCTIEGFRGRGGAENILLLKQITILCTGYIHVCIV